jgi:dynein heavy chain
VIYTVNLQPCDALQVVSVEESAASAEAAKVQAIKDECEADLAEAIPALEAALKALDTLTKNDITEVKGMKSPPAGMLVYVIRAAWQPALWSTHHAI